MKRAVPRPAASRHAVILLVIAVALYAVARGSGAGWPIVVLAGLLAVLAVATVWPAAALARLTLSAAAPRDGTAGRPVAIELEVGGGRQPLKIRLVDPPGPSVWAEPPAAGRLTGVPARRGDVGCSGSRGHLPRRLWTDRLLAGIAVPLDLSDPARRIGGAEDPPQPSEREAPVDGTHKLKLAQGVAGSWSPSGSRIVYTNSFQLRIMNADGSQKRKLRSAGVWDPDWG